MKFDYIQKSSSLCLKDKHDRNKNVFISYNIDALVLRFKFQNHNIFFALFLHDCTYTSNF